MEAGLRRLIVVTAGALALLLAAPAASTLATDRYVDSQGTGSAPCTNPVNPCMLISDAINAPSVPGDLIHVGGGGYGPVTLPNGVSLIRESFASGVDTSGTATIGASGVSLPAVTIASGTTARTISGFTLRGGATVGQGSLYGNTGIDNLTVSGNTFDDTDDAVLAHLVINSGSPHITGNTFTGVDDDQPRAAIVYSPAASAASPEIDGNTIDAYFEGIHVQGLAADFTTANIHDNTISGIYWDQSAFAHGIFLVNTNGTVTANRLSPAPGQFQDEGIQVDNLGAASGTPLKFSRNQVYGFPSVSTFSGTNAIVNPIEFSDDVFANDASAMSFFNVSSVTATGITASNSTGGNFYEIRLANTPLTLDSSIVGDQGISNAGGGTTCTISFSRGPINGAPGSPTDCVNDFQTNAGPMFANPAANNFHLVAGSPMIDAGNPNPPADPLDFEGDARALSSVGSCSPPGPGRRDIGADEFVAPLLDCIPPDTTVSGKSKVKTKKKKKRRVSFTLASNESGVSFECSVDDKPFVPCTSPFSTKLKRGRHTLRARAKDASGNQDATPASFDFKIKKKKPA